MMAPVLELGQYTQPSNMRNFVCHKMKESNERCENNIVRKH